MDILLQLKNVYATLNAMSINGCENVEKMYGSFYVLKQVIQELEVQKQEVMEKEKALSK